MPNLPQDSPQYSPLDSISAYLSPAIRIIGDFQADLTGTVSQVLHVKKEIPIEDRWGTSSLDDFGESGEQRLEISVIHNVIIKYPGAQKSWIFSQRNAQETLTFGISPEENLPIEFFLRFSGDYGKVPVALQKDDVIVDYIIDENSNKIPIYLQVTQIFGSMFGKNIVRKLGNLAPYRGNFEKSLQEKVSLYLANLPG